MKLSWPVEIAGTGVCLPERVVPNAEFVARLETSDEWIVQRTGIRERRFVAPGVAALELSTRAGQAALADAGLTGQDLDLIICGTLTPEHILPSNACELQAALGCRWIPAFDLNAACSGFVWSFLIGAQYIASGLARTVLVVGVDVLSGITDMEDRGTCILFGDGCGAAVLRRSTDPRREILAAQQGADGQRGMLIHIPAGGSKLPASPLTIQERLHYMRMKGREVYRFAVTQMQEVILATAQEAGVDPQELAVIIPHQSNLRIIESAAEKVGLPIERFVINIDRFGNTSGASVAIALHEARAGGRIKLGELTMLLAFGGGLTWGSVLLRT